MTATTAQRMARICGLVGLVPILPVRGATEPAIFYRSVADRLGVSYVGPYGRPLSKAGICKMVCKRAGLPWQAEWDGSLTPSGGGGSISNDGLEQLERAARRILQSGRPQARSASSPTDRKLAPRGAELEVSTRLRGLDTVLTQATRKTREAASAAVRRDASLIVAALQPILGSLWDGRESIIALRAAGSRSWRQMEWIGWFFEETAIGILGAAVGGSRGPKIGRTAFDYRLSQIWDLKTHPRTSKSRECPLNDELAIRECIRTTGSFGLVVLEGDASYDDDGSFKAWHDELKGGMSPYEVKRMARGARSRARKVRFFPDRVFAVAFTSDEELDAAVSERWLKFGFQEGMRNEGGAPRPSKGTLRPDLIPQGRILAAVEVETRLADLSLGVLPASVSLWDRQEEA